MAGIFVHSVGTNDVAANTVKTLLQVVAPTHQRLRIKRMKVDFQGASAAAKPARVRLLRQTTAGTASAGTVVKTDPNGSETVQSTSQVTFTVEPTASDVLWSGYVPVFNGGIEIPLDFQGWEVAGGGKVGIDVLTAAAEATVASSAALFWEE